MTTITFVRHILIALSIACLMADGGIAAVPTVRLNSQTASLQSTLYPDYYALNAVSEDMRWVARNLEPVQAFWQSSRDSILSSLVTLSGIDWTEREFDIYIVRYYPTEGEGQPTIIPIGGIRTGVLTEAAPSSIEMHLNIIYQLARRLLQQADRAGNVAASIANHPLMDQTPFRRDNLAMLLAMAVARRVLGQEVATAAYQSPFWNRHHIGRVIYEELFHKTWIVSPDRPLLTWIDDESPGSVLVISTEPPEYTGFQGVALSGVPLKGQLGFSTKLTTTGRLEIDKIDRSRLGYAAGLRTGDVINLVDGARVRSAKEMVEAVLNGLSRGGATLQIVRGGKTQSVVLQPRTSVTTGRPANN